MMRTESDVEERGHEQVLFETATKDKVFEVNCWTLTVLVRPNHEATKSTIDSVTMLLTIEFILHFHFFLKKKFIAKTGGAGLPSYMYSLI